MKTSSIDQAGILPIGEGADENIEQKIDLSATTEINDDPEGVDQPKKGEVITLDAFRKKRT